MCLNRAQAVFAERYSGTSHQTRTRLQSLKAKAQEFDPQSGPSWIYPKLYTQTRANRTRARLQSLKSPEEMAEVADGEDFEEARERDCSFVWDETSKLYFHASSGFYHDPNTGWYYSSRDGRYYAFDYGTYVPQAFDKDEESEPQECTSLSHSKTVEDEKCSEECFTGDELGNQRPPSEWLEEILNNLYLLGHSSMEVSAENTSFLTVH